MFRRWHSFSKGIVRAALCACLLISVGANPGFAEEPFRSTSSSTVSPEQRAKDLFNTARARLDLNPDSAELGWQFARAAFDLAEFAKDNKQREQIALQGIAVARRAVVIDPQLAPARYYLAMNLGQLARTKSLGALKLVDEMEREFKKVRELDELFDHAGPDRNLGLLYLEAPSFSVGDRKKARVHLLRSVELAPNHPENRLNLIEAYLKWGEKRNAQAALVELDEIWPTAQKNLVGEEWSSSWEDWAKRRSRARNRLR
ncbi:MAG: tetratricopeptide repeat protein [Limisphaerales bacterium]